MCPTFGPTSCILLALPRDTATWPVMLLSIVDGVSCTNLLHFVLGNDVYVWLYDPSPWYYFQAVDAIVYH